MIDFTEAEIGTKVECALFGKGKIRDIRKGTTSCIHVSFEGIGDKTYTKNGSCGNRYKPTLCYENGSITIDQGTLPYPAPKPLVFTGEPVWALVGDESAFSERSGKRLVIAHSDDGYLCICDGLNNTDITITKSWTYAWELPKD